jgi:hypothetical protein
MCEINICAKEDSDLGKIAVISNTAYVAEIVTLSV